MASRKISSPSCRASPSCSSSLATRASSTRGSQKLRAQERGASANVSRRRAPKGGPTSRSRYIHTSFMSLWRLLTCGHVQIARLNTLAGGARGYRRQMGDAAQYAVLFCPQPCEASRSQFGGEHATQANQIQVKSRRAVASPPHAGPARSRCLAGALPARVGTGPMRSDQGGVPASGICVRRCQSR